jgi:hypothetical protein
MANLDIKVIYLLFLNEKGVASGSNKKCVLSCQKYSLSLPTLGDDHQEIILSVASKAYRFVCEKTDEN